MYKKKRQPEIREINYGIGYTICDKKPLYIELNKNLKKYPKLRKKVIKHELMHWNSKGWFEDFKIDFYEIFNLKGNYELFKFQLRHPKAFLSNSPILIENKKIIPNYFMIGFYVFLIMGGILI